MPDLPRDSPPDAEFRAEVRTWLADHLSGEFAAVRGKGGPGSEHVAYEARLAWDRHLAAHGWTCIGWPREYGGRGLSLAQQVIFHEEYARAEAPARVNHLGEELLGPTLIAFGTEAQKQRFLPPIRTVEELWCQGYSEPGAGSDLAAVSTRARPDQASQQWVIDGQKVWTSNAHLSDWIFVIARTEPGSRRHAGLSFLLVPMDQEGVEVRPIRQLTGTSEFNEVFFSSARTDADLVVGDVGQGWRVAMALLGFERGVSTIGQQVGFDRPATATVGLEVMRANALRTLAMDVLGAGALTGRGPAYDLDAWQRRFLFTRADTIYGGSDEIQRNILAERVLGLPREPKGATT